jgi:hypothetical protein
LAKTVRRPVHPEGLLETSLENSSFGRVAATARVFITPEGEIDAAHTGLIPNTDRSPYAVLDPVTGRQFAYLNLLIPFR